MRTIDGRPQKLRRDLEDSLRRLQTDVIDLYYLHRFDKVTPTPLEDSVGMLSRFVEAGKVRHIGLSEASAQTIRKAHAIHPLAAVQSEYSLWSRNVEVGVLDTCAQLGIAFVAFSPLARGFPYSRRAATRGVCGQGHTAQHAALSGASLQPQPALAGRFSRACRRCGLHPRHKLALAWVLQRGEHVHVIPGTTAAQHLEENMGALEVEVAPGLADALDTLINPDTVSGARYPAAVQAELDTELLPSETA